LAYLGVQLFFVLLFLLLFGRRIFNFLLIFKWEFSLLFIVLIVVCFRDGMTGEVVYLDRFFGWTFQSFVVSSIIILIYEDGLYKCRVKPGFEKAVYLAILLASFVTLALYFIPPLDEFYESIQLDAYYEIYSAFDKRYRAYGVAENLTFTYAFVLGLGAGLSLIYARFNLAYMLFVPILVFGVSVNARIGFVGFFIIFLYLLFLGGLRYKVLIVSFSALSSVVFLYFGQEFLSENEWSFGFFIAVVDFLVHGLGGDNIVSNLISNHIVVPSTSLAILFGTGVSVYGGSELGNSDIGYIIQLTYGGLFFLISLFSLVVYMIIRLFNVLGWRHWYSWFFPISIAVLNFKGFVFAMTPGGRVLILLYLFYVSNVVRRKFYSSN
jgi:hypothetical protein